MFVCVCVCVSCIVFVVVNSCIVFVVVNLLLWKWGKREVSFVGRSVIVCVCVQCLSYVCLPADEAETNTMSIIL